MILLLIYCYTIVSHVPELYFYIIAPSFCILLPSNIHFNVISFSNSPCYLHHQWLQLGCRGIQCDKPVGLLPQENKSK